MVAGKTFPAHAQPAILRIWQETHAIKRHGTCLIIQRCLLFLFYDTKGVNCNHNIFQGSRPVGLVTFYIKFIADKIRFVQSDRKRICACIINQDGSR